MLEALRTPSGLPLAKWNGMNLISPRDPVGAAQEWVAEQTHLVHRCPVAFVMGLGCAYHLIELRKQFPDQAVIVIEFVKELVDHCQSHFSLELSQVQVLHVTSLDWLLRSAQVQSALVKPYAVLEHRPSCISNPIFYKEIFGFLMGRDPSHFQTLLRIRKDRRDLFEEKSILQEMAAERGHNELISISHCERWLRNDSRWQGAGLIIQALRELVK